MMKYAIMWSSFESFSMDLCQDVKLDGYYSEAAKIICDFSIGTYFNGSSKQQVNTYNLDH